MYSFGIATYIWYILFAIECLFCVSVCGLFAHFCVQLPPTPHPRALAAEGRLMKGIVLGHRICNEREDFVLFFCVSVCPPAILEEVPQTAASGLTHARSHARTHARTRTSDAVN